MPYNKFAELRNIQDKLLKANPNKFMNNIPNLSDYLNKTPSCPKCKAYETFLNKNDEFECAVCSHIWH